MHSPPNENAWGIFLFEVAAVLGGGRCGSFPKPKFLSVPGEGVEPS